MRTARLRLVPGSVELFDAELAEEPAELAALLGVAEVHDWPPTGSGYDRDALEHFRAQLAERPDVEGWNSYYACLGGALVGNGGYFGPPTGGTAEIGYSVCLPWRGQGIATELVSGLVERARSLGVERLIAHTRSDNIASITVLTRNGFREEPSDQPGHLLWTRGLTP